MGTRANGRLYIHGRVCTIWPTAIHPPRLFLLLMDYRSAGSKRKIDRHERGQKTEMGSIVIKKKKGGKIKEEKKKWDLKDLDFHWKYVKPL